MITTLQVLLAILFALHHCSVQPVQQGSSGGERPFQPKPARILQHVGVEDTTRHHYTQRGVVLGAGPKDERAIETFRKPSKGFRFRQMKAVPPGRARGWWWVAFAMKCLVALRSADVFKCSWCLCSVHGVPSCSASGHFNPRPGERKCWTMAVKDGNRASRTVASEYIVTRPGVLCWMIGSVKMLKLCV
eukprot:CAMPEP_0206331134 /NCGR_PEP_ID=MMETSP0106_2-20121207/24085_1 /ASSEMBLY_ACC=CAM_ASM_000206 /TAXON_ID=81532 /ORGANISM="Acanthoeca-like sp., Strain 10tr" /LENGTH=188 /DNA_ID=CAMNT_0053763929 /DNA_START=77 /DNA_END=644 /DNA_ORIENTATION=+